MEIETIGIDPNGRFTDPTDFIIEWLFKLYPWEWLFAEEFAKNIPNSGTHFIEPAWKTILSNKAYYRCFGKCTKATPTCCRLISKAIPQQPNSRTRSFENHSIRERGKILSYSEMGSGRCRIRATTDRRPYCASLSTLTRIQRQLSDGWLLAGRESARGNVHTRRSNAHNRRRRTIHPSPYLRLGAIY